MIEQRDLLIELRDGAQGVEARFLRGSRQGFKTLSGSAEEAWRPFAATPALLHELIHSAAAFRSKPDWKRLAQHGMAIWDAFDGHHQDALRALRADRKLPIQRVALRVAEPVDKPFAPHGDLHSARDLWRAVAWEGLLDPKDESKGKAESKGKERPQTFFLGGEPHVDWAFRRVLAAAEATEHRRLPKAPIRVLLLLTSLLGDDDDQSARLRATALDAIRKLREVFEKGPEVQIAIAGSRLDLEEDRDGRWCIPGTRVAVDLHYASRDELESLLAVDSGAIARHAVLFFGHSDAEAGNPHFPEPADAMACGLRFHLDEDGKRGNVDIPVAGLATWLAKHPLELVAALNCASAPIAESLLALAPAVIATNAMVPGHAMAQFVARLLEELRDDELLSAAFVAARNRLTALEHRPLVTQLSRALDDVSFLGPRRRALAAYHDKLQRQHRMLRLPGKGGREAAFERVHVQLELSKVGEDESWIEMRTESERRRDTQPISFERLLADSSRCWVLRGVAGAGKTTTLRRCALEPPEDCFAVYVSLPVWLGAKGHPPTDDGELDAVLASIAATVGVEGLADTIRAVARRGLGRQHSLRVAILLDAFDELDSDQREIAQRAARTLSAELSQCPIVISSRETAELDAKKTLGARWETARLLPLDARHQFELARAWQDPSKDQAAAARQALLQIHEGGPRMAECAGNPLLLTLLVNLQLDGQTEFRGGLHLVMKSVLDRLLAGEWLRNEKKLAPRVADKDALRRLLRALSWDMLHRREGSPRHVVDEEELVSWLKDAKGHAALFAEAELLKSRERMNCPIADLPGPIADESPFCPEDPARMRHWTFTHNLLQEALCAEHWWSVVLGEDRSNAAVDRAIAHLRAMQASRPDALDFWTEPCAMLAGWMGNDRIVRRLLESPDTQELGLRAMRAVDRLLPETVDFALRTLPAWAFDQERWWQDKKSLRVEAYEIIAAQMQGRSKAEIAAMAKVLTQHARLK
ncbi:MAG: NACHT domain-containing protein [Planctomycetes bacterium]|nr:NACHT domain-containing protein [Planctomycetota bacterium]